MEESRTKNSIENVKTGMIMQVINRLMTFVVRTVFIKILNVDYLGVNGLFSNILTMLSFAELGIGTAIIFNMYKPVAEKNIDKIKSLMQLYKKSYNLIGIVVFILGLLVIPFMDYLVKDVPNIKENIIVIYILFLINTSLSYFYTYKKSIISAHQKESIINNISSILYLIKSLIEIAFLIITKNYIVYLVIEIVFTLLQNIIISIKADRLFPYLKEKKVVPLLAEEKKSIFKNIKSLIVYKFGTIIMFGSDNIILSAMINVQTVGTCSNYTMIINAVKSIITAALNGITASIGNLNAENDIKKKKSIFYQITLINFWIFGFCAIAFIVLLNPFIEIWVGKDYVLSISIALALSISFFIEGMRTPCYTYRITLGLFEKGKITPYIGTIVNIVSSIILCKIFGAVGIFIGTSLAQLSSYSWIDAYLIHKYGFKESVKEYFKKYFIYIIYFSFTTLITVLVTNQIMITGILGILIKGILVCIIVNILFLLFLKNSVEFKEVKDKIFKFILKKQ